MSVRTLSSFPDPRPTTNPYIAQLARALEDSDEIKHFTFSWRRALTRRFDVFHAHWPEILVGGRPGPKKAVRQGMFAVMMVKFALQGTAVVRTVHNLHLPQGVSTVEHMLLAWLERRTHHRVILNPLTPVPSGQARTLITHGHYRDWYSTRAKAEPVPGRIVFVGLVRRYKGVESLVRAFRSLPDPDLSLTISGRPSHEDLVAELQSRADHDPRIGFRFDFLDDSELVATTTQAELVVLPYQHMHNSGGVLAALSLDRPVLVPDNPVNRQLALEVGPEWVQLFAGELDGTDVRRALNAVRAAGLPRNGARPELSARGWAEVAHLHGAAYRQAMTAARKCRAGRRPVDDGSVER